MLDPKFVHAQQEYARLKRAFDDGSLRSDQFEAALQGLIFEHEGLRWTIGASTGKWFVSSGDTWVEAVPPVIGPDLPEHPTRSPAAARPAYQQPAASAPHAATPPRPAPAEPVAGPTPGKQRMISWGVGLLFIGVISFVLPLIGMQFRLLSLFGEENETAAAVIAIVLGGVLTLIGRSGSSTPTPT